MRLNLKTSHVRFDCLKLSHIGGTKVLCFSILMASCEVSSISGAIDETSIAKEQINSDIETLEENPTIHVTLKASDARVNFLNVSSHWGDLDVEAIGTPEVKYTIESEDDHGVECEIEPIRLLTSNKAVIVPSGNICLTSPLLIDVSWPDYNSAPVALKQAGFRWELHEISPTESFPFSIDRLSYSLPETDNIAMSLQCTRGSQSVQLQFEAGASDSAAYGNASTVDIVSQDRLDPYLYRFSSKWSYVDMGDGFIGIPTVYEGLNHPFFLELKKDSGFDLIVESATMPVFRIDTKPDVKILKQFLQLCNSGKN